MRYLRAPSVPTIFSRSAGVLGRCEPVPLMIVKFSAGTWESSAKSQGRRRSEGRGRVMSGITTATLSFAAIWSFRGRAPIGRRMASRNAEASSGRPGTKRGSTTVTLGASISRSSPAVPYWSLIFFMGGDSNTSGRTGEG